tara:strand:- start:139 stop:402 length:264 start_codon:yes stop_codon:yes gene_type:complete
MDVLTKVGANGPRARLGDGVQCHRPPALDIDPSTATSENDRAFWQSSASEFVGHIVDEPSVTDATQRSDVFVQVKPQLLVSVAGGDK